MTALRSVQLCGSEHFGPARGRVNCQSIDGADLGCRLDVHLLPTTPNELDILQRGGNGKRL